MISTSAIVTDIEGTTSAISFVKDVLFPYADEHLDAYVAAHRNDPVVALAEEVGGRAVIADLSQGGMTFKSEAVLEQGMTLHLKLPTQIEIRGEVRSVGAPVAGQRRYGVRFHKIGYLPNN